MGSFLLLQILDFMRSGGKPKKGQPKEGGFTEQLQVLDAEVKDWRRRHPGGNLGVELRLP